MLHIQPVLRVSCIAVIALFSTGLSASTWIKSVESCEECEVRTAGTRLPAEPLLQLNKDDAIKLSGEGARIVLVNSSNKQIVLKANTTYRASDKASDIVLPAAAEDALEWFRQAVASLLPGGSMISTGRENPPLVNGMDSDSNRIPKAIGRLVFVWDFGQGPFTLALFDGSEKLVFEGTTPKQKLAVALDQFPAGDYRFVLKSTFDGEAVSDEYPFSIVESKSLPDEVLSLDSEEMPETIRKMFQGIMLAQYPEWRFMALQLAIQVKDKPLARALLEEESH